MISKISVPDIPMIQSNEYSQTLMSNIQELQQQNEQLQRKLTTYRNQIDDLQKTYMQDTALKTIIEHQADALVVDAHGIVRFVNPAAETLFGRPSEHFINSNLGIPLVKDEKTDVDILTPKGNHVIAEMRVVEIIWDGELAFLASFRDITDRKQFEKNLERLVAEQTLQLRQANEHLKRELEERERIERDVLRRDTILEAVEFAATRLMTSTNFWHNMPTILEYLGNAALVERVLLVARDSTSKNQSDHSGESVDTLTIASFWYQSYSTTSALSTHRQTPALCNLFPRWKERLSRGFPIYGDVRTFPQDEQVCLEHQQIHSVVVVPIFVEQQWWGFLEFDTYRSRRCWSLAEINALRGAANTIGTTLYHEHMQQILRTNEERFRMIADFAYDWECWMDNDRKLLYVSPSCEKITGYSPEAFMRNPALFETIIHPDDRDCVKHHFSQTSTTRDSEHITYRILTQHGEERWIEHFCQPVQGTDGRWLGRRISNRDITERKHIEEDLRIREAQYRGMFERLPLGMFQTTSDGQFLSVNLALAHMSGYDSPQDFINTVPSLTTLLDNHAAWHQEITTHIVEQDHVHHMQHTCRRRDGNTFPAQVWLWSVRDTQGAIQYLEGIIQDAELRYATKP